MPLDEATRRLATALHRELDRVADTDRSRTDRGEEVRFDSVSRMATWETRRGDVIGRWYGEVVASYSSADRILRWAWAGRTSLSTPSHAEVIAQEGQLRSAPQLAMSLVGDLDEEEAFTLARLGIVVAKGEGIQVHRVQNELRFIGLFDSPRPRTGASESSRYSVPPPPVAPGPRQIGSSPPVKSGSAPAPAAPAAGGGQGQEGQAGQRGSTPPPAYRSLPPIREIFAPRTTPRSTSSSSVAPVDRIREPARALFVPVATAALNGLAKGAPGFQQALFVLNVVREREPGTHGVPEPRRLVVMLVAVDVAGNLRALDPTHELVEAAARMIEADRHDGNGPWRKLSARITPKADGGATLYVDVV